MKLIQSQPNKLDSLASGDYAVINSSRIYSDALLPALYLGTDPKDNTKHIFMIAPETDKIMEIHKRLLVVSSKTLRVLPVKWETKHRDVNAVLYGLHQSILKVTGACIINVDVIITEEA